MARGRKAKPAHLRLIEGDAGHRPRPGPVLEDPRPLGGPPEHWSAGEKSAWDEVAARLIPGVARETDRTIFELLVQLLIKTRSGYLTPGMVAQLRHLCTEFGMSPASRARLISGSPPPSKFDGLLGRRPDE